MGPFVFRICAVLHLLAALIWLGHMFFWSVFSGPVLKKIQPAETAGLLRQLSMHLGGTGWPALGLLLISGSYMLWWRAPGWGELLSLEIFASSYGQVLAAKLALVLFMIAYQAVVGHRPAPRAIFVNMLVATGVLAASVFLARL